MQSVYTRTMRMRVYFLLVVRVILLVKNWPVFFMNRLGLVSASRMTYRLRSGWKIVCRPFSIDRAPLNDVWLEKSYEPSYFGVPFDWASCRTIIDIGANIGMFTLYAAASADNAKIFSYEPEPGNFGILQENIAANGLQPRVQAMQGAVSDRTGTMQMYFRTNDTGGHSLYRYPGESYEMSVSSWSLADVFKAHGLSVCDFLKLDCEGGEYGILYGAGPELLQNIRCIALEYHHFSKEQRNQPAVLLEYLRSNGFTIYPSKKSMCFAVRTGS